MTYIIHGWCSKCGTTARGITNVRKKFYLRNGQPRSICKSCFKTGVADSQLTRRVKEAMERKHMKRIKHGVSVKQAVADLLIEMGFETIANELTKDNE